MGPKSDDVHGLIKIDKMKRRQTFELLNPRILDHSLPIGRNNLYPNTNNQPGGKIRLTHALILLLGLIIFLATIGCHSLGYNGQLETGIPVTFTFHGNFRSVCISGDFNNWSRNQCLSYQGDGFWSVQIFLNPGHYRYGFLLNGKIRVPDPQGLLEVEDGFGNRNSVLILE
jgi:hypothetical protein